MRRAAWRGFTLVELMVVIAIGSLLMAVVAPLGKRWADGAAVRDGTFRLHEGMANTKALALRNVGAQPVEQPAAYLVLAQGQLCVYADAPSTLSCGSAAVWQTQVKATIQLDGKTSACVALNNQALPSSDAAIGSSACGVGNYVVAFGSERYPSDGTLALY